MFSQIDYESFLDNQQLHALQLEIQTISQRLDLPAPLSILQNEVMHSHLLISLSEVDPKGVTLMKKLIETNRIALLQSFGKCASFLTQKVRSSIEVYIRQRNLKYIISEFEQFVRRECRCVGFSWQGDSLQRGSLWMRLKETVRNFLQFTLEFMTNRYEMGDSGWNEYLQNVMNCFQAQLHPFRINLQNLHPLDQQLTQSLLKYKEEQCENMNMYKSQISEAINQLQQLQKVQQQKQNQEKSNQKMQQEEEKSLLNIIKSTKSKIVEKLSQIFVEEQTIPLKKETVTDLNNLEGIVDLTQVQVQTLEKLSYLNQQILINETNYCFNQAQLSSLQFTIKKPFLDWEAQDLLITGQGKLVQDNYFRLCKYRQKLNKVLKQFQAGHHINQNRFLIISLLFYRVLKQDYSTLAKRYLGKVLQTIQLTFASQKCNYLRGALKIYETDQLRPSQLAIRLQNQLPYRSRRFQESVKSKIRRESDFKGYYGSIQNNQQLKKGQYLKFQRLNYAKPTKNVTFLISGFLSEDTEKDLQWLGVIRALQDTQLYGVVWRSGTKLELINYVGMAAGAFAMKGLKAKGGNIMALVQVAQIGLKVASFFTRKLEQNRSNPFWGSLVNATQTGVELADKIISQFSDRHITLIGFSMGTQVIASCLERLIEKKQEKLILKIVTLGGVADRDNVHKIIEKSNEPLTWLNFHSRKDFAVKYVYRVCTLGSKPIGSDGIRQANGHQILNWQVGNVVNGHMDFRPNLHGLCLIAGLKND